VNRWLVEQGWVYPSFYDSMEDDEIEKILSLAAKAKSKAVPKALTKSLSGFDAKKLYRSKGALDPAHDKGPVLYPKLFRRQAAWYAHKKSKIFTKSMKEYIAAAKDEAYELDEYLTQHNAANRHPLAAFIDANKFSPRPEDLVFHEQASTLVDANGKPIKAWW
jgi:hypothetical protein